MIFLISLQVERILNFAINHKMIEQSDKIQCRNELMNLLKIEEPYEGVVPRDACESPVAIIKELLDYCVLHKIIEEDTITRRDLMDAKIMGILMPRQSEVIRQFNMNYDKNKELATNEFYELSKASNYIQTDRIGKNLFWKTKTEYGELDITINLSKPEKDPKEIMALKNQPATSYPKCLLCLENVGFHGTLSHPARENHRVIPLCLNNENWYFQYSPYVYYNEHCIIFNEQHIPMKIQNDTFKKLLDFLEKFPHYFIGGNADLPIVGGSILSHDHFQGGRYVFAMEKAPLEETFLHRAYESVTINLVKWPMSVIRLSSKNREALTAVCISILSTWRSYSDVNANIVAFTGETPHNTITPIARINKNGEYEIDMVLRNNRTDEQNPLGIFHPHQEHHHIKKENIGLIEVMGLAVLPGRLKVELDEIKKYFTAEKTYDEDDLSNKEHKDWVGQLIEKYGMNLSDQEAEAMIQNEVGEKFLKVLCDAGVYKRTEEGKEQFKQFMTLAGFELKR